MEFNNGITIQWGHNGTSKSGQIVVWLPIVFHSIIWHVTCAVAGMGTAPPYTVVLQKSDNNAFYCIGYNKDGRSDIGFYWIAIGY